MATYVIGDVHGQFDALMKLLSALKYDENKDELWFVGDFVNRGPKSLQVLRFVCDLYRRGKAQAVLGNHDFSLLVQTAKHSPIKPRTETLEILAANDAAEIIHTLRQLPMQIVDESRKVIMVHAGFYPLWTLSMGERCNKKIQKQLLGKNADKFLAAVYHDEPSYWDINRKGIEALRFAVNAYSRMRYLKKDLSLDFKCKLPIKEAPKELTPWFKVPQIEGYRIVFGHWAALGVNITANWACIDGGAAWDGELVAFDLDKWQVAAKIKV